MNGARRIGYNATISAPHMHAHAAENLLSSLPAADFKGGAILDVGSGSGYRMSSRILESGQQPSADGQSRRCSIT